MGLFITEVVGLGYEPSMALGSLERFRAATHNCVYARAIHKSHEAAGTGNPGGDGTRRVRRWQIDVPDQRKHRLHGKACFGGGLIEFRQCFSWQQQDRHSDPEQHLQ